MKTKFLILICLCLFLEIQSKAGNNSKTALNENFQGRIINVDLIIVNQLSLDFQFIPNAPEENLRRSEALCAPMPGCEYPPIMCIKQYQWGCSVSCCNVCYCPGPPF